MLELIQLMLKTKLPSNWLPFKTIQKHASILVLFSLFNFQEIQVSGVAAAAAAASVSGVAAAAAASFLQSNQRLLILTLVS